MKIRNLFEGIPDIIQQEHFKTLAEDNNVRIERIVSAGHATEKGNWYNQNMDEWVIMLSGSAELLIEGENTPFRLRPGDYTLIPAGCRHRVEKTDPDLKTVWLAIHYRGSSPLE